MSDMDVRSAVNNAIANGAIDRGELDRIFAPNLVGGRILTSLFFDGPMGDFIDRSEYQEALVPLYLIEQGKLVADEYTIAQLKAFRDRGPDSRLERVVENIIRTGGFAGLMAAPWILDHSLKIRPAGLILGAISLVGAVNAAVND
ncbi:MAG: hypothetical protein HYW02_00255 [Deltaproteobacteria bacterium]|nr:hypothetical protein [Deltaproteobacteria bacterium]MBI2499918.1 hypothetical protein [Deltaproteobacteria bacterium]